MELFSGPFDPLVLPARDSEPILAVHPSAFDELASAELFAPLRAVAALARAALGELPESAVLRLAPKQRAACIQVVPLGGRGCGTVLQYAERTVGRLVRLYVDGELVRSITPADGFEHATPSRLGVRRLDLLVFCCEG